MLFPRLPSYLALLALGACAALQPGCNRGPKAARDIAESPLSIGANWHDLEIQNGRSFRWATNDAEVIPSPHPRRNRGEQVWLNVEAEPGPGMDFKPFELKVIGALGTVVGKAEVRGRELVSIEIWPMAPGPMHLHVEGGGKPTPNDPRILNFRAFRISLTATPAAARLASSEIIDAGQPMRVGAGWYPIETYDRNTFRWVNQDAQLVLAPAKGQQRTVRMELEPGPGLDSKPFLLKVSDAEGKTVGEYKVNKRQSVDVAIPVDPQGDREQVFTLRPDRGGKPTPNDRRTLNFRVFRAEVLIATGAGAKSK